MFRFADLGRLWVPMTLPLGEEGEQPEVWLLLQVFTSKELREREATAMQAATAHLGADADTATAALSLLEDIEATGRADLLARTHDWRQVADDEGQPVPFDRNKLAALLESPLWFAAHRNALYDASRNGVRKNFKPGPAGTPARVQA